MKILSLACFLMFIICFDDAIAQKLDYEINTKLRSLYGYASYDEYNQDKTKSNFPLFGAVDGTLSYEYADNVAVNLYGKVMAQVSSELENLNQGHMLAQV